MNKATSVLIFLSIICCGFCQHEFPLPGRTYIIRERDHRNLCLTVDGFNTNENGLLNMWNCQTPPQQNQLWTMTDVGSYYGIDQSLYEWINGFSKMCLTAGRNLTETGNYAKVVQYTCQTEPNYAQLWKSTLSGNDSRRKEILIGVGGKCLSYDPDQGGQLYMYTCSDVYDNQAVEHVRIS